jgi:hypothetical protein
MAFVIAALLVTLGVGALLLSRKSARVEGERPTRADTGRAALEIASKRARWACFAVLASSVCHDIVILALERPRVLQPISVPYGVSAVLLLAAQVLYLRWLYRAVANTTLLRAPIKWTPGQAVAAYFIPIVSLFRPYQVMKALYAANDPSALHDAPVFRDRPAPNYRESARELLPPLRWNHRAPIAAWWGIYNLRWVWPLVWGASASRVALGGVMVTDVAAAVLCALVVRSVDARQRERHRRLEASAA